MSTGTTQPPMGIDEVFGWRSEFFNSAGTYGTALTPPVNNFVRPVSNSLMRQDRYLPLSGPTGQAVDMTTTRGFRATPEIRGTVVMEADYHNIGWWLLYAINDYATETLSGTSEYTRTVNFPASISGATTPQSFTCHRYTGQEQFEFTGCVVDALEISGARDRIVTVSADIIAQDGGAADIAAETPSYTTSPFIEFHDSSMHADFTGTGTDVSSTDYQQGPLGDGTGGGGGGGTEPLEWSVRIENNFRAIPAAGVGGRYIRQPDWAGYRRVLMTVTRDYFDDNFFDLYHSSTLAGNFGTFWILCSSDEEADTNDPFQLKLRMTAGHVTGGTPPEYGGGPDVEQETVTIEAGYDGSNVPFIAQVINDTATSYNDTNDTIV